MVVVLGFAFQNKPVEEYKVDVQTEFEGPWFREQLESAASQDERITLRYLSEEECRVRLKTGKSDLYIREAAGLSKQVEYVFDPTRPGSIVAKETVDDLLQVAAGREDVVEHANVEFNEPGGRYVDWLIPGLLGMGLMGGGLWGVGFAIVDMRIRKLLKRFLATPMRRTHYLIAIMISRLLFMVPEIILLVVFARVFFGVRVFGSLIDLVLLILIGSVQFSGIGLLIAARCRTLESVSGLMNLAMLPMWTLSGVFFSYERFPEVVHPLIQLLPLTPLNDALRAVMTEGTSIVLLWPQLLVMVVWTIVSFTIALWIFRWGD
jgi:ABC-type multidrug transport system permease subunit